MRTEALVVRLISYLSPLRIAWLVVGLVYFTCQWVLGAAHAASLALRPRCPARPHQVRVRTRLSGRAARAALAAALTVAPGVFAVTTAENRILCVHCETGNGSGLAPAVRNVFGTFESLIERIVA